MLITSSDPTWDQDRPASPARPTPPALEDYDLENLAGVGGHGMVYRARRRADGLLVALKVPRRQGPSSVRMLDTEARALRALDGLDIAPSVVERPEHEGVRLLAMDWVPGRDLQDMSVAGLTVDWAVRLFADLVDAVQAVHDAGWLHADIKSRNVRVTRLDGRVTPLLLDFGIAMPMGQGSPMSVCGTPATTSPERYDPTWRAAPAADAFGLGCILYEMLTGRPAFSSKRHATLCRRVATRGYTPLDQLAPRTPAGLAVLVDALLSPEPEDRPSLMDVRRALPVRDEPVRSLAVEAA